VRRPGERYRVAGVVLVLERVDAPPFRAVGARDAKRSGFATRDELAAELPADDDTPVNRIAYRAEQAPPAREPPRPAAADAGMERLAFKANVRKLKSLGLKESLEWDYRLTPFGRAYVRRLCGA
jgi:hypothetical protein